MQAVVLTRGNGRRLSPLTDTVPELLLLIEQEPALHLLIRRLEAAGIKEIIVIGGGRGYEISSWVLSRGYRSWIQVLPEPNLFGDAGAIRRVRHLIHGVVLIVHADAVFDFDLRPLLQTHFRNSAALTVAAARDWTGGSHSSIEIDDAGRVLAIRGPAVAGQLAETGPYLMERELLETIPDGIEYNVASDLIPQLISAGAAVFASELPGRWFAPDCAENYLECQRWFLRMARGGGFIHPSAWVAADAQLKPPFFVGPGSCIAHGAVVGPDAVLSRQVVVGRQSRLSDSIIYPGVKVGARCSIEGAIIASDVHVLDDVTLEPNVIIGANACIADHRLLPSGTRIAATASTQGPPLYAKAGPAIGI